jgi:hypothetical protein
LPREFLLEIPSKRQTYEVELRWRQADAVGVRFKDHVSGDPKEAGALMSLSIEELRAEVAPLRRQRAEMVALLSKTGPFRMARAVAQVFLKVPRSARIVRIRVTCPSCLFAMKDRAPGDVYDEDD